LENLGVYESQKMSPFVIPGEERQSPWGAVGRIAGTIGGALIGGPAGAALGGTIGGTAGSFF
jgi:outer membrane lipoprotein SlyB